MTDISGGKNQGNPPNDDGASSGQTVPLLRVVECAAKLAEADVQGVYVVGGIVRDILSHGRIGDADLDLVVEGDGISFAHKLADAVGGSVKEHLPFHTAKLLPPFRGDSSDGVALAPVDSEAPLSEVDVASARIERYVRPGALPEVTLTSIVQDLFRRDFSINAVAVSVKDFLLFCRGEISRTELQEKAVDPCNGVRDLDDRKVRILHPRSFIDDPTRLFRCVRYVVRLGLSVDEATTHARMQAVCEGALQAISTKRIWNEVVACASESLGMQMLRLCGEWGLFERAPFLGTDLQNEIFMVVERLHSRDGVKLREIEVVETVLAATILRNATEDAEHESPIHVLQLPRQMQRKAATLAQDEVPGKGAELFESPDLFGTLRWIVTGVA